MTAYTGTLGLALPVQGTLDGTWGDTVNTEITSLIESAITATTTVSADSDVTLTKTNGTTSATYQARNAIVLCSGSRSAVRTVTAPASSKIYMVINDTTGGYAVTFNAAGPTTGVSIANVCPRNLTTVVPARSCCFVALHFASKVRRKVRAVPKGQFRV